MESIWYLKKRKMPEPCQNCHYREFRKFKEDYFFSYGLYRLDILNMLKISA